jgi:AraC-like DNA-binding protein
VTVRIIRSAIEAHRLPLTTILADAGLPSNALDDPEAVLSEDDERALTIAFVAASCSIDGLWFQMGLQQRLMSFGPLGLAALTAATMRDALTHLAAFSDLDPSLLRYQVVETGDEATIVAEVADTVDPAMRRFFLERGLGATFSFIHDINPGAAPVARIDMAMEGLALHADLAETCGVLVVFEAPLTRLVLKPGAADASNPMFDDALHHANLALCLRLRAEEAEGNALVPSLGQALLNALPENPSAAAMSRTLGLSERTLHRRLAEAGLTYGAILDEARRHRAAYLLRRTSLSVQSVAEAVGYSENASFTRAFKRWTGLSPLRFRSSPTDS